MAVAPACTTHRNRHHYCDDADITVAAADATATAAAPPYGHEASGLHLILLKMNVSSFTSSTEVKHRFRRLAPTMKRNVYKPGLKARQPRFPKFNRQTRPPPPRHYGDTRNTTILTPPSQRGAAAAGSSQQQLSVGAQHRRRRYCGSTTRKTTLWRQWQQQGMTSAPPPEGVTAAAAATTMAAASAFCLPVGRSIYSQPSSSLLAAVWMFVFVYAA